MRLLAIDTSSSACSVALRVGERTTERHVVEPREHTKILMPMIAGLLDDEGIAVRDLDAIVLGNGPGSFIGMRIGASVAQGLCHAANLKIIPVSSLAAVAAEAMAEHGAEYVVVAQDAHMHEVYVGYFHAGAGRLPVSESAEAIVPAAALQGVSPRYQAAGDAWNRYPSFLEANAAIVDRLLGLPFPRARFVLEIGAAHAADAVDPASLIPAYLRTKVAERPDTRA